MARPKGQFESKKIRTYNLIRGIAGSKTCFAKTATLARRLGVGERQVYRYLASLREEGKISTQTNRTFDFNKQWYASVRHVKIIAPMIMNIDRKYTPVNTVKTSSVITITKRPPEQIKNDIESLGDKIKTATSFKDMVPENVHFKTFWEKQCWSYYLLHKQGIDPGFPKENWGPVVDKIIERAMKGI